LQILLLCIITYFSDI